jgi:hypothetical protein
LMALESMITTNKIDYRIASMELDYDRDPNR